jgi:hypothetical protein
MNLIMGMEMVGQSCFDQEIDCQVTLCLQDEPLQLPAARL